MNIAELFVTLGVKGDSQAQKSLQGVKGTLGEISSGALAAKAAVVGAVYALERMMSNSVQTGTALQQFSNITGLSADTLQRYQYAAIQAGATSEGLTSSVKAVQNAFTGLRLGKGAPEALEALQRYTGGLDRSKLKDTFYIMQKIQELVQKAPADITRNILPSLGITEDVLSAMHQNAFTERNFKRAPVISNSESAQLQKVGVAWENMWLKIKKSMADLTAKGGLPIVKDISQVADQVLRLVEAFSKLAEQLKLIQGLGVIFKGWAELIGAISDEIGDVGRELSRKTKTGPSLLGAEFQRNKSADLFNGSGLAPIPRLDRGPNIQGDTKNWNINVTHHGDAKDTKAVVDSHKAAAKHAYRTSSAQAQVN